ncbi:MAG: phage Gp37/Gp68 family protein [Pyrinomonadaceae bacterium]
MAENSGISWTDHTFNPWMGCTKVSPACDNCYAERDMDHRYGKVAWGPKGTRLATGTSYWLKPAVWNAEAAEKGRRYFVFCASLADVFENWKGDIDQPKFNLGDTSLDAIRKRLWKMIEATPNLDWLLLTKRPENVLKMVPENWLVHLFPPNVLIGCSAENQKYADIRLRAMRRIPARRFVSYEPATGPVDWSGWGFLDWLIAGGESGPEARTANPDWYRSARSFAKANSIPFHFKQWGEYNEAGIRVGVKTAGRILDGRTHDDRPLPLIHGEGNV